MKPKILLLSLFASLLFATPALAGSVPFPPVPPKPPAPPITRNCKPYGSCVLACVHNTEGSTHNKWEWMSLDKWTKYHADHPDAFIYLGTFDTDLCAYYNGFLINVGNGWDGLAHPETVITFTAPVDPGDRFAIYTIISATLTTGN